MNYDEIEKSTDLGQPIFFYEFLYSDSPGGAYRYVANSERVIAGGKAWQPRAMTHTEITTQGTLDKQSVTIKTGKDVELTPLFIVGPPSRIVQANIYRSHAGLSTLQLEWTGRVLNGKWAGAEAEFACEPIFTSLVTSGLRRKYQRGCPHTLYGKSCGASQLAHTEQGKVLSVVNAVTVRVQMDGAAVGLSAGNVAGGIFRVTLADGITEIRAVTNAVAEPNRVWTLTLISQVSNMAPWQKVSMSKGCPHTFEVCRDTFQNVVNFGGCPNIPTKNPFNANQF